MKQLRSEAGFSLVELLAVVLILSVLSAVAVPLYMNTRRAAAARTCKANIAAIAAAESAYALRNGKYGLMANLLAAPEGLSSEPKCPLKGDSYAITDSAKAALAGDTSGGIIIHCPNDVTEHQDAIDADDATAWNITMPAIPTAKENGIP